MKINRLSAFVTAIFSILLIIPVFFESSGAGEINTQTDSLIIDSVVIENNNIFDLDSAKYDYWPFRLANKFHIITRPFIIKRELLLREGDPFSRELADESERNLRELAYLWNAEIELIKAKNGKNVLKVVTNDRWTLSAGASFKRLSGENTVHLYLEESNLFGFGQFVALNYYSRDYDDDFLQFSFVERRLLGTRNYLDLYLNDDPNVGIRGFEIGRPYYSLEAQYAFSASYSRVNRRDDYYSNGNIIAQDDLKGDWLSFYGGYRFGERLNKVRFGVKANYKNFHAENKRVYHNNGHLTFPDDSTYYIVGGEFGLDNFRFIKTRRIKSFALEDDITLKRGGTFGLSAAFDDYGTRLYNIISLNLSFDIGNVPHLLFLRAGREIWYHGNRDLRKTASVSILYYNNRLRWMTSVARALYYEDIRDQFVETVYLGENLGLRGLPKNFSTGEKRFLFNYENRFYPGIEILSVHIGMVQFIDMGQTWDRGEVVSLDDMLFSIGAGLRFGTEKLSTSRVARFDVAYSTDIKDWQISFGLGQFIGLL